MSLLVWQLPGCQEALLKACQHLHVAEDGHGVLLDAACPTSAHPSALLQAALLLLQSSPHSSECSGSGNREEFGAASSSARVNDNGSVLVQIRQLLLGRWLPELLTCAAHVSEAEWQQHWKAIIVVAVQCIQNIRGTSSKGQGIQRDRDACSLRQTKQEDEGSQGQCSQEGRKRSSQGLQADQLPAQPPAQQQLDQVEGKQEQPQELQDLIQLCLAALTAAHASHGPSTYVGRTYHSSQAADQSREDSAGWVAELRSAAACLLLQQLLAASIQPSRPACQQPTQSSSSKQGDKGTGKVATSSPQHVPLLVSSQVDQISKAVLALFSVSGTALQQEYTCHLLPVLMEACKSLLPQHQYSCACRQLAALLLDPVQQQLSAACSIDDSSTSVNAATHSLVAGVLQCVVALQPHVLLGCTADVRSTEPEAEPDDNGAMRRGPEQLLAASLQALMLCGLQHPDSHTRARALHILQAALVQEQDPACVPLVRVHGYGQAQWAAFVSIFQSQEEHVLHLVQPSWQSGYPQLWVNIPPQHTTAQLHPYSPQHGTAAQTVPAGSWADLVTWNGVLLRRSCQHPHVGVRQLGLNALFSMDPHVLHAMAQDTVIWARWQQLLLSQLSALEHEKLVPATVLLQQLQQPSTDSLPAAGGSRSMQSRQQRQVAALCTSLSSCIRNCLQVLPDQAVCSANGDAGSWDRQASEAHPSRQQLLGRFLETVGSISHRAVTAAVLLEAAALATDPSRPDLQQPLCHANIRLTSLPNDHISSLFVPLADRLSLLQPAAFRPTVLSKLLRVIATCIAPTTASVQLIMLLLAACDSGHTSHTWISQADSKTIRQLGAVSAMSESAPPRTPPLSLSDPPAPVPVTSHSFKHATHSIGDAPHINRHASRSVGQASLRTPAIAASTSMHAGVRAVLIAEQSVLPWINSVLMQPIDPSQQLTFSPSSKAGQERFSLQPSSSSSNSAGQEQPSRQATSAQTSSLEVQASGSTCCTGSTQLAQYLRNLLHSQTSQPVHVHDAQAQASRTQSVQVLCMLLPHLSPHCEAAVISVVSEASNSIDSATQAAHIACLCCGLLRCRPGIRLNTNFTSAASPGHTVSVLPEGASNGTGAHNDDPSSVNPGLSASVPPADASLQQEDAGTGTRLHGANDAGTDGVSISDAGTAPVSPASTVNSALQQLAFWWWNLGAGVLPGRPDSSTVEGGTHAALLSMDATCIRAQQWLYSAVLLAAARAQAVPRSSIDNSTSGGRSVARSDGNTELASSVVLQDILKGWYEPLQQAWQRLPSMTLDQQVWLLGCWQLCLQSVTLHAHPSLGNLHNVSAMLTTFYKLQPGTPPAAGTGTGSNQAGNTQSSSTQSSSTQSGSTQSGSTQSRSAVDVQRLQDAFQNRKLECILLLIKLLATDSFHAAASRTDVSIRTVQSEVLTWCVAQMQWVDVESDSHALQLLLDITLLITPWSHLQEESSMIANTVEQLQELLRLLPGLVRGAGGSPLSAPLAGSVVRLFFHPAIFSHQSLKSHLDERLIPFVLAKGGPRMAVSLISHLTSQVLLPGSDLLHSYLPHISHFIAFSLFSPIAPTTTAAAAASKQHHTITLLPKVVLCDHLAAMAKCHADPVFIQALVLQLLAIASGSPPPSSNSLTSKTTHHPTTQTTTTATMVTNGNSPYSWLAGRESGQASLVNGIRVSCWQAICLLAPHLSSTGQHMQGLDGSKHSSARRPAALQVSDSLTQGQAENTLPHPSGQTSQTRQTPNGGNHNPAAQQALVEGWRCLMNPYQHANVRAQIQVAVLVLLVVDGHQGVEELLLPALRNFAECKYQVVVSVVIVALFYALHVGPTHPHFKPILQALMPWALHHRHAIRVPVQVLLHAVMEKHGPSMWSAGHDTSVLDGNKRDDGNTDIMHQVQAFLRDNSEMRVLRERQGLVDLQHFDLHWETSLAGLYGVRDEPDADTEQAGLTWHVHVRDRLPLDLLTALPSALRALGQASRAGTADDKAAGSTAVQSSTGVNIMEDNAGDDLEEGLGAEGLAHQEDMDGADVGSRTTQINDSVRVGAVGSAGTTSQSAPFQQFRPQRAVQQALLPGAVPQQGLTLAGPDLLPDEIEQLATAMVTNHQLATGVAVSQQAGLIVVASLLDNVPNMAGLCRTCESMGIEALVLPSRAIAASDAFKKQSVTSERWLRLLEVGPSDLPTFLQEQKSLGYTIIGLEQATNSVPLQAYSWPQQVVLLLGNEQNGVPAPLLPYLDACVEIPMLGVTRSLNAHVSGAMAVWQYTQQHAPLQR